MCTRCWGYARVDCGGVRSLATAGVDVHNASVPVVFCSTTIIIYSGFHDVSDTCTAFVLSNAFYGKFFSDDDDPGGGRRRDWKDPL